MYRLGGKNMHLDYIRSFCRVVKVKSITKAAGELHLSQPALSLQINCLENRFGTKLLERTNRSVKVTSTGELVYRQGLRMLKILETLDQDLQDIRNPSGRKLKISTSPVPGNYILPVKMLDFAQSYPESKFSVTINPIQEVIENIIDQTANIGVIAGPLPPGSLARLEEGKVAIHLIGVDSVVPICHRSSPWSKIECSPEKLISLPLILPHKDCGIRAVIEEGFYNLRLSLKQANIVMELDNCVAITSAVKASVGIGLVPRITCAGTQEVEIIEIPNLVFPLPFTLLVSANLEKTPAIKGLISFLSSAVGDKEVTPPRG
jgi:DNA-binding transcriptional LysR family regulator